MPAWNDLVAEFTQLPDDVSRDAWVQRNFAECFAALGGTLGTPERPRNVVLYYSGWLQKQVPSSMVSILPEDINGFMSVIYGMDWSAGLTLVLHTPGGSPNAAQTIVEYLRSKFDDFEVIVPAMAMSAGTMISLAADRIVMGRQSQLGPIDPQMGLGGRSVSCRGIVEQFKRAETEILANPDAARVWAPITQSLGPALLQDAQNALDYSEEMVADWLARFVFRGDRRAKSKGRRVAKHFNDASTHKSHGRRIDASEAERHGLNIARLEDDQELQEQTLSLYHLATILIEQTPMTKIISASNGRSWVKNQQVGPQAP